MEKQAVKETLRQRVSFRLKGVAPDTAMNFGLTNFNRPQKSTAVRNPPLALTPPPILKRRMTVKPASPSDVPSLKKELETQRVLYEKQIQDIKSFYKELMNDIRKECDTSVEEAKKKEWCANCSKLAKIYCCWNTCYCDDLCQKKHWESHAKDCERKDK